MAKSYKPQGPDAARQQRTPPDGPMEDREIVSLLRRKIENALNQSEGEYADVRQKTLDYYVGKAIGDEDPNRSTYRTREVFEVVEWALPAILSVFFSSKRPFVFEPHGAEDVAEAEQVTDAVNYFLFQRENSFLEWHNFFKSALLDPVAYAKVHTTRVERSIPHKYDELTDGQLVRLVEGKEWESTEIEAYYVDQHGKEMESDAVMAAQQLGMELERRHRFEGVEIVDEPEHMFEAVPPEDIFIEQSANHLDLDDVFNNYGIIAHRAHVSFTDLLKRGYDEDMLNEAAGRGDFETEYNEEEVNRKYREDERPDLAMQSEYSNRKLAVYECYYRFDADGDGVAEGRRVVMIGTTMFENERVEYQPFVALSSIPMPFKHGGLSLAESMMDMQEVSTVLHRMMLDDSYKHMVRRRFINRQAMLPNKRTLDQLRNPDEENIEVNGDPRAAVFYEPDNPILENLLPLQEYFDRRLSKRSGVSPDNALNPDVLKDATAHGMLASADKSSQRLMHIVRLFAELGVKKVARKMHTLLRLHQSKSVILKLRGEFVDVAPSEWRERNNVKVTVGLGFNSKDQRLQALMQILMLQKEAMAQGGADYPRIFHTVSEMIESADLGFGVEYFVPPEEFKPPEPPPDPQMELVKAQRETKMAEVEADKQKAQLEAESAKLKHQIEMKRAEVDEKKIAAENFAKEIEQKRQNAMMPLDIEEKRAQIEKVTTEEQVLRAEIRKMAAEVDKMSAEMAALKRGETQEGDEK